MGVIYKIQWEKKLKKMSHSVIPRSLTSRLFYVAERILCVSKCEYFDCHSQAELNPSNAKFCIRSCPVHLLYLSMNFRVFMCVC